MQIPYDCERTDILLDKALEIHREYNSRIEDFVDEVMAEREKCSNVIRTYDTLIGRFGKVRAMAANKPQTETKPKAAAPPVPYQPASKLERYRINQGLYLLDRHEAGRFGLTDRIWTFSNEEIQFEKAQQGLVVQSPEGVKYVLYDHRPSSSGFGSRMPKGWKLKSYANGGFLDPKALQFTDREVRVVMEWLYAYDYQILDEVLGFITLTGNAKEAQEHAHRDAAGDYPDKKVMKCYAQGHTPVMDGITYFSPRDEHREAIHIVVCLQPPNSAQPGWAAYNKYTNELLHHTHKMHPMKMHDWLQEYGDLVRSAIK